MTHFNAMLDEIRQMQIPIITITNINNRSRERNYIIIADGIDKVTVFVFDDDNLRFVNSLMMDFPSAITYYSQKVLNNPGSTFKLMSF